MPIKPKTSSRPAAVRLRIMVVDDHPMVRERLGEVINREPDLRVCGEAEDRFQALQVIGETRPDLVIVGNAISRGNPELEEVLDRKIRMFELVVGEMEEILGTWQVHGSFEDEVFRRWTESITPTGRKRRFTELAQHLVTARKLYQQQRDSQSIPHGQGGCGAGSWG